MCWIFAYVMEVDYYQLHHYFYWQESGLARHFIFHLQNKKIIFNLHLNSYFVDQFFMSADSSMLKGEHLNRNMFDIWTMNRVFLGEQPTFSYWTRTVKLFVITDATMMSWQWSSWASIHSLFRQRLFSWAHWWPEHAIFLHTVSPFTSS